MKVRGVLFAVFLSFSLFAVPAFAKDYEDVGALIADVEEIAPTSTQPPEASPAPEEAPAPQEGEQGGGTVVFSPTEPVPVVIVDEEEASLYSVSGSGYTGDISSSIKQYFAGIVANNPGAKYVAFKLDRYTTYLFYGRDLSYSNASFSGSGSFLRYNSESQLFTRGTDSLNFSDAGYYVYSNLDDNYAELVEGGQVTYAKAAVFVGVVLLCYFVFSRIFFRRSGG